MERRVMVGIRKRKKKKKGKKTKKQKKNRHENPATAIIDGGRPRTARRITR
jgi:hypothetical protein